MYLTARRKSSAALVGIVGALTLGACTDDTSSADDEVGGSESGTDGAMDTDTGTDTGICDPGSVNCVCDAGACEAGLNCVDEVCVVPVCGDGIVDEGEACDDGNQDNTDNCVEGCVAASCGDGFVGPGEGCDDGNDVDDDECSNACTPASCGDGIVQAGEDCDDGNADDTDACLSTCAAASCGDGFIQAGVEGCDDGNDLDTDECPSTCEPANCGDGFVWEGMEPCDDGNEVDTDACLTGCVAASCGDGFVWEGTEACDDANEDNTDMCTELCELPACGDGFLQPDNGEVCDDGNLEDGDGCEASCLLTPGAKSVAAGGNHSCAVDLDGAVYCWGSNALGQLGRPGIGELGDDELPNTLGPVAVGGTVQSIAAGFVHSCAILEGGALRCWGYGASGALGYGNTATIGDDESPEAAGDVEAGGDVEQVVAGAEHTCALISGGTVRCWGSGTHGRLGYGNTQFIGDNELPLGFGPVDIGGVAVEISAGATHSCALRNDGQVLCWGRNNAGQLGYGNTSSVGDDELPVDVGPVDVGAPVIHIAAGWEHSCALTDQNQVVCWGNGGNGRLGYGDTANIGDNELPSSVGPVDLGGDLAAALGLGWSHSCALLEGGGLRCWGQANLGQLGLASTDSIGDDELPSTVGPVDLGGLGVALSSLYQHSCAILSNNALRCWGRNANGQLGYGNTTVIGDDEVPASAGAVPFL